MNKIVLNVGSNVFTDLPEIFDGWNQHTLDIDASTKPDILLDARELIKFDSKQYDAVYCSHNLEHYHAHDVHKVLKGFRHILKDSGFVYIKVPDLMAIAKIIASGVDPTEPMYWVQGIPVSPLDAIYGWNRVIESSGSDFFAHKTGFTSGSLVKILAENGFEHNIRRDGCLEVQVIAFINKPEDEIISKITSMKG